MPCSERPILFSAEMVRAILDGRKTQTRRIVKSPARNMQASGDEVIAYRPPGDPWYKDYVWSMRDRGGTWGDYTHERFMQFCPYGQPGDRLWVRETFYEEIKGDRAIYRADGDFEEGYNAKKGGGWRPSIFMPRWASRITLEVTGVRVERLQDISEDDIDAEGFGGDYPAKAFPMLNGLPGWYDGGASMFDCFAMLWDSINAKRAPWASNPWVWCMEFRMVQS